MTAGGVTVLQQYNEANADVTYPIGGAAPANIKFGQGVAGNGQKLLGAGWWIRRVGNPTGSLTSELRFAQAIDQKAYAAVLQSSNTLPPASIGTTFGWHYFDFPGTYQLTNGTAYNVALTLSNEVASASNCYEMRFDSSTPTSPGATTMWRVGDPTGDLSVLGNHDCIHTFTAVSDPNTVAPYDDPNLTGGAATTNRLGAGTGSFVAGKVSETGLVTDLGWTGNNYTELLYSLTFIKADLANGDTIRFRVLRNGVTTGMTFTQTPTVNLILGPGPVALGTASSNGVATVTAALGADRALVSTASNATSTTTSALAVGRPLAAVSNAAGTAAGTLTVAVAPITLVGSSAGATTVGADLLVTRGLAGAANGLSTDTSVVSVARSLIAATAGTSTTTSALARAVPLASSSAGLATDTGALRRAVTLTATSNTSSTTSGALSVAGAITPALPGTRALETGSQRYTEGGIPRALESAGGPVAVIGSTSASSTASGALRVAVPLAATTGGLSTVTAATAVARSLVSTSTGLSTVTAVTALAKPLAATSAGQGAATGTLVKAVALAATVGGAPTTTVINDIFDGTAGTPLTAYTPPYVSDQYYQMLVLDGAGNAVTPSGNASGGATHTVGLPTDCWAEWMFSLPELTSFTNLIGQIRLPQPLWYHGYNVQLLNSPPSTMGLLRNDSTVVGGDVAVTLQANFDHVMRIEARGANFKLFLDGVMKLDWTDPAPLTGPSLVGPYTGYSIYTNVFPNNAAKLRSYRAGGLGVDISTAVGDLTVFKAGVVLAGSSAGTAMCGVRTFLTPAVGTASTLDTADLRITSDLTLVAKVKINDVAIVGTRMVVNHKGATNGYGFTWFLGSGGHLMLRASLNGTAFTTTNATPGSLLGYVASGEVATLAVSLDVDNGAGGHTYTARALVGGVWVNLGDNVVAGLFTGGFDASELLRIGIQLGGNPAVFEGNIYSVEQRSGLDPNAGGVLWRFDASEYPGTGTVYADPRGRTWTLTTAGAITTQEDTPLSVTRTFAANAAGISDNTGALVVARAMVASVPGTSTASATTLVNLVAPTATSAGLSTVTSALTITRGMATSATGTSTVTAALAVARSLASTAAGVSTVTAAAVRKDVPLASSAAGVATTTAAPAAPVVARTLVSSTTGISTAAGAFIATRPLVASAAGTSSMAANLLVSAAGGLAAQVPGTSTVTAALGVNRALVSGAAGLSTVTAVLAKTVPLAATSGGSSTTTAAIAVARRLVGASAGVATVTGTLARSMSLAGTSGGTTMQVAALARDVPVAAAATGSSTAATAVVIARALVSESNGQADASAAIRSAFALVTSADGLSTVDGVLALEVSLEGAAVGLSDAVGDLISVVIIQTYGMWNGQIFEGMYYGDKEVIDWLMIST